MAEAHLTSSRKEKILYLESLRGIAALIVVFLHFQVNSSFNCNFTRNGFLMVDFFFVLSGLVISMNYQERISSLNEVFNFQLKRFLRLYPLHLTMLILFLFVECLKYFVEVRMGLTHNNPAFSVNNPTFFVYHIFLVQSFVNDSFSWNGPAWSISAEFYVYLAFAILAVVSKSRRIAMPYLASVAVVLAFSWLLSSPGMSSNEGLARCLFSFFLGVVGYNLMGSLSGRVPNIFSYSLLALIIWTLSIADHQSSLNTFKILPFIFALFILSLVCSKNGNRLKKFLNNRILVYLGTVSYGIYMIHTLVIWVFSQFFRLVLKMEPTLDGSGTPIFAFESAWTSDLITLLFLATVIALAHASYVYLELPCNNLRYHLNRDLNPISR